MWTSFFSFGLSVQRAWGPLAARQQFQHSESEPRDDDAVTTIATAREKKKKFLSTVTTSDWFDNFLAEHQCSNVQNNYTIIVNRTIDYQYPCDHYFRANRTAT